MCDTVVSGSSLLVNFSASLQSDKVRQRVTNAEGDRTDPNGLTDRKGKKEEAYGVVAAGEGGQKEMAKDKGERREEAPTPKDERIGRLVGTLSKASVVITPHLNANCKSIIEGLLG
ncbi:hypothetical protein Trydic_g23792 [Trypoxylus dichotomus]